jgi:hypothetical protein
MFSFTKEILGYPVPQHIDTKMLASPLSIDNHSDIIDEYRLID